MRNKTTRKRALLGTLVGAALLLVYGLILFSSDPEWLMWAGSMTMGILYTELPPVVAVLPHEAMRTAGVYALLGLLAAIIFVENAEEKRERLAGPPRVPRT